jgi:hypothetical protein
MSFFYPQRRIEARPAFGALLSNEMLEVELMTLTEMMWEQGYLLGFAVGWVAAIAQYKYLQSRKQ